MKHKIGHRAKIAGLFAIVAGYFFGVQKTANNIPIQSNNRQYGDIYAHQIIFNENGTFKINGIVQPKHKATRKYGYILSLYLSLH